jgi:hypothetical protein
VYLVFTILQKEFNVPKEFHVPIAIATCIAGAVGIGAQFFWLILHFRKV